MTRKERRNPALLDGSRRRRIAAGAGVQVQDVNRLMKQFMEMQKMMKSMAGGKLKRMLQAFKGGMPPGFPARAAICNKGAAAAPGKQRFRGGACPLFGKSGKPSAHPAVCVESALFFGRPGRAFRPGAT